MTLRRTVRGFLPLLTLAFLPFFGGETLSSQYRNPADPAVVTRISLDEFKRLFDAGEVLVIDVRSRESYRIGHIPGALWVPFANLEQRVEELKASGKPIVTYCT
jgi:predicted sulfurtransferase